MYKIMKKMMIVSLIVALLASATGIPAQAASKTKWKKLYVRYFKTIENFETIYPSGEFIYVDNDSIPELYLIGNCNAAGSLLVRIYKNRVYAYQLMQPGDFFYLKKQNRFWIGAGRDESYCKYVAKFSKEKMLGIAGGVSGFNVFHDGNVKLDKEGRLIYQWYWNDKKKKGTNLEEYYQNAKNGRKVTKKQYDKKLNQALGKDRKKYKYASSKKTIRQIKKKLRT